MKSGSFLKPLIFLVSLLVLVKFKIDTDLGWHLAYGERFLDSGEILRRDIFTWTAQGYEWGNSYFAFQILAAWINSNLGFANTAIIFGIIAALSILIIVPSKINLWGFLLVGLGSALALVNAGVRPHNVDWPFFGLLLLLLYKQKYKERLFLPFWFIFFAAWANFHVGFVFGLATMASVIFFEEIIPFAKNRLKAKLFYLTVLLVGLAGTFMTPFHYKMWKSIILDSAGFTGWSNIQALQSTAIFTPFNILMALTGFIHIFLIRKSNNQIPASWIVTSSFIFLFSFFVVDFVYLWALVFIFLGSRYFKINLDFFGDRVAILSIKLSLSAVILAFALNLVANYLESIDLKYRFLKDNYPLNAVNYIVENDIGNNLFNEYEWGGYIIWQAPELKVFIDGRLAGWRKSDGGSYLAEYLMVRNGKCEVVEKYNVKTALLKQDRKYKCFDAWQVVYEDDIAKVLLK